MKLLFTMDLTKLLLYKKGAAGVGRPSLQNFGSRISDFGLDSTVSGFANPQPEIRNPKFSSDL